MIVQETYLEMMILKLSKAGDLKFKLTVGQASTSNNWKGQHILYNNANRIKRWKLDRNDITLAQVKQLTTTHYYNNHITLVGEKQYLMAVHWRVMTSVDIKI